MNHKSLLWSAPVIVGGVFGLVVVKPKQSQSNQTLTPVITPATTQQSVQTSSKQGESKQQLDSYLLSAQSLLTKAIALSKESDPNNNQQIVELINEAIDTTNRAIVNYPTSAQAYAQQAKIYQTIISYMPEAKDAAIAYWQQAIKIDSNNPEYYTKLADIYLNQTDTKAIQYAIFYLEKAVETDPTNPDRLKKLAKTQSQAGQINQAKTTYQRLLGILSDENQIAKIQSEIDSLNKLLAEAASEGTQNNAEQIINPQNNAEIALPDSPPKLQASDLAGINTFIAEPRESEIMNHESISEVSETNAKSGTAVIPAGKKQVEICNDNLGPDTQVYLVPEENNQNTILFVKSKSPYNPETAHCPNFIAGIAKPLDTDLKFRWWIIDEK
jgi:tetratricopeptide (TPR) repeat protein